MKKPNPSKKKRNGGKSRRIPRSDSRDRRVSAIGRAEVIKGTSGPRELDAKSSELRKEAGELDKSLQKKQDKLGSRVKSVEHKPAEHKPVLITDSHLLEQEDGALAGRPSSGKPFPIVGIGASAGGFEAFSEFLKYLPADTGMAFVLVQHLNPKHKSQLSELLGRTTRVPVVEAEDNVEVAPNQVYVIPANARITIQDGRLRVSPRKENELPPMPIDAFFRSLASEQQDQAIGIVLSGTGTDGTLGIEAIKGEGGITFAQHESSAKYYGMPGSAITSGNVDFVLTSEGIAAELGRIAQHPYVGRAKEMPTLKPVQDIGSERALKGADAEMGQLFSLLRARTGVDFALYKPSTLRRRIVRQMILQKFDSLGQYVSFLERRPREVDSLFNDLLIYVTSFFRDPKTFQALKKTVFPKLLKARADDLPLRFWVCGCSTGEEAYSLAISLIEFFEQNRTHRPVQIFASDVNDAGINKARAGIYPQNIMQDISAERLRRFFSKTGGHYQVNKSVRDMVVFARQNVIVDPPFSNLDLITCRNVLIYLDAVLQRKIMSVFHYALQAHGLLVLGNSETVGASSDLFSLANKKDKIYRKKQTYSRPAFPSARKVPPEVAVAAQPAERANVAVCVPDLHGQMDKLLLRDFAPAAVLVSADLEVLHFRGRTGEYLEHSAGAASLNLLRMVRESLAIDLRSAVSRASKNDSHVKHTSHLRRDGHDYDIVIEVIPLRPAPDSERFFVVIFRELGRTAFEPAGPGKRGASAGDAREIASLKAELALTRESLQTTIEEQEANNEELKSANEEIQSTNEELQSTNEELETAKEELQSTNEELTTLNEELQTRNSEVGQANNDLTNLLASINVAILMLGEDLTIRRYTPTAERMFNLIPSDLGRRFSDLNRSILIPDLEKTITSVMVNLTPLERDVQDRDGNWYSLRIRPYRTRENKIEGVVIMLVDIDQLKDALEMVLTTAKEPLLTLGADLKVRKANDAFYHTFHMIAEETEGRFLYEAGRGQWNTVELRKLLEEVLPKSKEIHDFPLEADFREVGQRKLLINASRFYDEGWGLQTILMAIEDVTGK